MVFHQAGIVDAFIVEMPFVFAQAMYSLLCHALQVSGRKIEKQKGTDRTLTPVPVCPLYLFTFLFRYFLVVCILLLRGPYEVGDEAYICNERANLRQRIAPPCFSYRPFNASELQ